MANLATIRVELIANAQKFKKNVDSASASLKKVDKATSKTTKGSKKLQDAFRNTAGSIAAVQGPLGPVAGRISSIGAIIGRVNPAMIGLIGAFVAVGAALTKFIKAGANAESQFLKLEALLKATGGAAKQTGTDIEAMAVAIGRGTLASVQGARDAAGVLLTFKSIAGDTFKRTLELTQDLAAVGFGNMRTAALQLGKALEEPEIGLSALRRVGVSFTEEQKEQIKVLSLTGKQAEAQNLILKALEEQVGGAGKGAAGGLAGAFDTLGENITLFFEKAEAGKAIVSALTTVINGLANVFGKFVPDVQKLPDEIGQLNNRLEESDKTITFLSNKFAELGDQITEQNAKAGSAAVQRSRKLKKQQDEINKQIFAEVELNNRIKEKIALLSKEEKAVVRIDKTADKINNKLFRQNKRALEDAKANNKELRVNNDLRKLEDALRSKLGEGAAAEEEINRILRERSPIIRENAIKMEEFKEQMDDIKSVAKSVGDEFNAVGMNIVDAFLRGKQGALDFKAILRELIIDIQKAIIKKLILDKITGVITEGIEGIFAPTEPTLGTGRGRTDAAASGGTVQAGTPTLVGERGPELFVPGSAGKIMNNADTKGAISGSGVSVVQNLNFAVGVTNTVRAEVMNMLPAIQQSTISAVADAKQRGGKFSKAFGN
jgi:methyl-accepting chemotaxis protein